MFTDKLIQEATILLDECRRKGLTIATAESCTGGLLAALLTDIPGASDVFRQGYITYSNRSKTDMLGVNVSLIEQHGAVSNEVAAAMAQGAYTRSGASLAVAITGIAGPSGGTAEKPVGLVYIAVAAHDSVIAENSHFNGSRGLVRIYSVERAIALLRDRISRSFVAVA